jgi:hypothetical protein
LGLRLPAAVAELADPRGGNAKRLLLWEVLMIALCKVLSGGESCADLALVGQMKESFLKQFLALPHGGPNHYTFNRVFRWAWACPVSGNTSDAFAQDGLPRQRHAETFARPASF